MIRSGLSVAIFSKSNPSAALSTVGFASPSASRAHGHTAYGCSPYHSVVAIGVWPRASTVSCSVRPTTAIRSGSRSTVVVPNLCSTVAGNGAPVCGRRRGLGLGVVGAAAGRAGARRARPAGGGNACEWS